MNVTYSCPQCGQSTRLSVDASAKQLICPHCDARIEIPNDATDDGQIKRCLVCPSTDLYVRKDFPQRLGVALVGIGIVGSSVAWAYSQVFWTFAILFSTALADLALYAVVGNALMCYRCHAQYRGAQQMDAHGAFDLETFERYRQLAARVVRGP